MSRNSAMIGVGLRQPHFDLVLRKRPQTIDWFEALTENHLDTHGNPYDVLIEVSQHYPIALHGVGLSIASSNELNREYLLKVKKLADKTKAFAISDHLCFTGITRANLHELIPIRFNDDYFSYVFNRFLYLQDYFKRPFYLENVASYFTYKESTYSESEFLNKMIHVPHCKILLDINNVFVNSRNHNFDPIAFIDQIPAEGIGEIHLGGHVESNGILIDTHSTAISEEVWNLFHYTLNSKKISKVPILIEWDNEIPAFSILEDEVKKARSIWAEVYHG